MFVPLNFSHRAASGDPAGAGALGAADSTAVDGATDAAADGAAADGATEPAGDALGVEAAHPARTRTKPIAGATDLNRDTGILLLTLAWPYSILNGRR